MPGRTANPIDAYLAGLPADQHAALARLRKQIRAAAMNGTTVMAFKAALKGFSTSKGTIRFTPEKPLPAALVRRIVKARVAENERRRTA